MKEGRKTTSSTRSLEQVEYLHECLIKGVLPGWRDVRRVHETLQFHIIKMEEEERQSIPWRLMLRGDGLMKLLRSEPMRSGDQLALQQLVNGYVADVREAVGVLLDQGSGRG